MKVIISVEADHDLLQIYYYLRKQSPQGAKTVADRLRHGIESLASLPARGAPRADLGLALRLLVLAPYSIIYAVRIDHVTVLRVLHGSRDIESEMNP